MKTLFIDFDGTISTGRFWSTVPSPLREQIQKLLFEENKELVRDWMRGRYSSEDINLRVAKELSISYEELWEYFVVSCRSFMVPEGVIEVLTELKNKYHVVLITGNMDSFDRFTAPSLNLANYFHEIVNSFNEGCLKHERGGDTFKKYLVGDIKDAILVEDSIDNCEFFTKLGGVAYRTESLEHTLEILRALV